MNISPLPKKLSSFLALVTIGLWSTPAWAVQSHGGLEGLVSHEIGHVLFIIGITFLLYRLYRIGLTGSGWGYFKTFLWLIIGWNILTFSGHWLHEYYGPANYLMAHGQIIGLYINSPADFFFYLSRLDHLLLVPAFIFLFLALKKWRLS